MRILAFALLSAVLIVPSPDVSPAQAVASTRRTMAVTIDDLPFVHRGDTYLPAARRGTDAILAALKKHNAPAVGFVNEVQLDGGGPGERAARIALLQSWVDAGHVLGNHTFSHPDANGLTVEAYLAEVDKGELVTKGLMQPRRPYTLYFRHPMTHTGDTAAKKAGIADGLKSRGYTIAPHTIENSDYLFDAAYEAAAPEARARLADAYLTFTMAATQFAEEKARELFGRDDVPQTLLIHTRTINADHLDALLDRLAARGYRFITLDEAMRDRAYATPDAYVGKTGPTWLFRWSRTIAPTSDFKADPELPAWVFADAKKALGW